MFLTKALHFKNKLSIYSTQINVLLIGVRAMSDDYDDAGDRESDLSLTMALLVTALANAQGWALEAQRQLKEQEDASV